jgi:hypothetical protein
MEHKISEAIVKHNRWKFDLKNAIESGNCQFTVAEIQNPHLCTFGKWLDSPEGKNLPDYPQIVELHIKIHNEAAKILHLALLGQPSHALIKMQLGSRFSQLSSQLIDKLATMNQKMGDAIVMHNRWKFDLKEAIATGQSNILVEEAKNPLLCPFGKWLYSAEGIILPNYLELAELHGEFHDEAANILNLALTGQSSAAIAQMQLGSNFSRISSKLIDKLAQIGH